MASLIIDMSANDLLQVASYRCNTQDEHIWEPLRSLHSPEGSTTKSSLSPQVTLLDNRSRLCDLCQHLLASALPGNQYRFHQDYENYTRAADSGCSFCAQSWSYFQEIWESSRSSYHFDKDSVSFACGLDKTTWLKDNNKHDVYYYRIYAVYPASAATTDGRARYSARHDNESCSKWSPPYRQWPSSGMEHLLNCARYQSHKDL